VGLLLDELAGALNIPLRPLEWGWRKPLPERLQPGSFLLDRPAGRRFRLRRGEAQPYKSIEAAVSSGSVYTPVRVEPGSPRPPEQPSPGQSLGVIQLVAEVQQAPDSDALHLEPLGAHIVLGQTRPRKARCGGNLRREQLTRGGGLLAEQVESLVSRISGRV